MKTFDQSLFDLYEAGLITYEDALRNADSLNDLRLEIKLHGKEAKNRNVFSGIGNLDIVPDAATAAARCRPGTRGAGRRRRERAPGLCYARRSRDCSARAPTRRRRPWPASTPRPRRPPRSSCTRPRACSRSRSATGSAFRLPYEFLRVYSPSAEVRGHGPGQETLQVGKRDVAITEVEAVGHYAIRPTFSDGHDTGIYSWDYLYDLGVAPGRAVAALSRAARRGRREPRRRKLKSDRASERDDERRRTSASSRSPPRTRRGACAACSTRSPARYDLMNDLMSAGLHRLWKRFAVDADRRAGRACACSTSPAAPATSRACSPTASARAATVVLTDINGAMLAVGRDKLLDAGRVAARRPVRRRDAAVRRPGASTASPSPSACATSRTRKPRSPRCAAC